MYQDKDSLICGVDEAGRGPVLGPMVIASVCIRHQDSLKLPKWGVKDSKALTASKREEIFQKITKKADVRYISIPPSTIDEWVLSREGLNALEAFTLTELLTPVMKKVRSVFVDAPSTPKSFREYIARFGLTSKKVIPEPKADKRRPVVSAASIIAKVIRDNLIKSMAEKLGFEIGSGYPSSPLTRRKLPAILKKEPDFVRKSWKTLEKLELK